MPVIPVTWEVEIGGSLSKASLGSSMRVYLKNKLKAKRTDGMAQVLESLSSTLKALSSSPVLPYHKNKKTKKRKEKKD
jgi:hypothetical protein